MNYEEFKEKYYAALKDLMDSFGCGMAAEIKAAAAGDLAEAHPEWCIRAELELEQEGKAKK